MTSLSLSQTVEAEMAPSVADRPASAVAPPLVYISVLHWDRSSTTIECFESIHAEGYPNLAVVLVDNGSNEVTCREIARRWPDTAIIRNRVNLGFAGGQNQGIEHALRHGAAFVLMLNDDAALLPGCISSMVCLATADRRVGLVSPVIYCRDDATRVQFRGAWVDATNAWVVQPRDAAAARAADRDEAKLFCLWGTALMIRRELIEQIGLLDDKFFAYYEDLDYSLRSHSAGWTNRMCFEAAVLHQDTKSVLERPPHYFYLNVRNELLWWRKHFRPVGYFRIHRVCLAIFLRRTAALRNAGLMSQVEASMSGLWDGYTGRSGPYRQDRKAPRWIRRLLLGHPYLLANILEGRWRRILETRS